MWLSSYVFPRFLVPAKSKILGCFWVIFHGLQPQIKSDLYKIFTSDAVQGNYGFWYSAENSKILSQKNNFLAFFQSFFDHALLRSMVDAQIFCQIKGLMEIHNRGKFYLYGICGCWVINFQMFSWRCSIHELGHFGGVFGT